MNLQAEWCGFRIPRQGGAAGSYMRAKSGTFPGRHPALGLRMSGATTNLAEMPAARCEIRATGPADVTYLGTLLAGSKLHHQPQVCTLPPHDSHN